MRRLLLSALLLAAAPVAAQEAPTAAQEAPAAAQEAPTEVAAAPDPVETATRIEADGTATMTHTLVIAAPIAEIWTAVSTPEGWRGWAAPLARWAEGERDILETSYNPDELAGGPGAIWQQFVAVIPGRLLVFRTIKAPDDFPHWEEYKRVTSFLELEPVGDATRVRLTSTGYPDSEGGRALVTFFEKGNAATLGALRRSFVQAAEAPAAP